MSLLNKILLLTLFVPASSILTSCKDDSNPEVSQSAYIIGDNDIKPLNALQAQDTHPDIINSSVLVTTRLDSGQVKFCSGTLIDGNQNQPANPQVITNHHCFAEVNTTGLSVPTLLKEACTATKIYFGFSEYNGYQSSTAKCKEGSLRTDFSGDVATFSIEGEIPQQATTLKFWDTAIPFENRSALIVHYPGIKEMMKSPVGESAKLPAASITTYNCATTSLFPTSYWSLDAAVPFSIRHTCDMIHGSSGSALIDKETNRILGINWGGIKQVVQNQDETSNAATVSSYVTAFLNQTLTAHRKAILGNSYDSTVGEAIDPAVAGTAGSKRKTSGKKGCGIISAELTSLNYLILALGLLLPLLLPMNLKQPFKNKNL